MNKDTAKRFVFFLLLSFFLLLFMIAVGDKTTLENEYAGTALRFKDGGVTAAQLDGAVENEAGGVKAVAFIQRGGEQVSSPIGIAEVWLYKVHGDMSAIMPLRFVSGGSAVNSAEGTCVIDKNTAFSLFGQSDAVGLKVTYCEEQYTVLGVIDSREAVVLLYLDDEELLYNELRLVFYEKNATSQTAVEFCNRNGISGYAISDGQIRTADAALIIQLPFAALFAATVVLIIKRLKKCERTQGERLLYVLAGILLLAAVWITLGMRFLIPLEYLPNSWSDFSHWSELAERYAKRRTELSYLPALIADTAAAKLFARCTLLSTISAAGLLSVFLHRKRLFERSVTLLDFAHTAASVIVAWVLCLIIYKPFPMPFGCVASAFIALAVCWLFDADLTAAINQISKFLKEKTAFLRKRERKE